jgi:hypothetical protein
LFTSNLLAAPLYCQRGTMNTEINLNPMLRILSKFDSTNNLYREKTAGSRRQDMDLPIFVI